LKKSRKTIRSFGFKKTINPVGLGALDIWLRKEIRKEREFVRNLSKSLSDQIKNNPKTKVNDLFKSIVIKPDNIKNTTPKKIEPIKVEPKNT